MGVFLSVFVAFVCLVLIVVFILICFFTNGLVELMTPVNKNHNEHDDKKKDACRCEQNDE